MKIAILNQSTRVTNDQADKIAQAINIQLAVHCAPVFEWLPDVVAFYADRKDAPADADFITLQDEISEPDALGFHTEGADGTYWAVIAVSPVLDNGGGVLDGGSSGYSVASVVSHEAVEMRGNRAVDLYADGPPISEGSSYAYELADPVEGDSYDVTLPDGSKVLVSNWVGPKYFDLMAPAGSFLDYCGKAKAPFDRVKFGYFVVRSAPGTEQQVFGEQRPPAWRMEMKKYGRTRKLMRAK